MQAPPSTWAIHIARPWGQVLAMTASTVGAGLTFLDVAVEACSRVANGRVSCVHLTYDGDRYLKDGSSLLLWRPVIFVWRNAPRRLPEAVSPQSVRRCARN